VAQDPLRNLFVSALLRHGWILADIPQTRVSGFFLVN
jgi:hypothetical protein